jgi:hypothetical protein
VCRVGGQDVIAMLRDRVAPQAPPQYAPSSARHPTDWPQAGQHKGTAPPPAPGVPAHPAAPAGVQPVHALSPVESSPVLPYSTV